MSNNKKFFRFLMTALLVLFVLSACNEDGASGKSKENEGLPKDFPSKKIDALVGFAPGGGQDLIMRTLGQIMEEEGIIDQSFIVENKTGAGGRMAGEEVKKDSANPYKLIVVPEYGLGFDPRQEIEFSDFKPIASVSTSEVFVIVRQDSPYDTIEEFLAALKEKNDVTISTLGPVDGGEAAKWDEIRQAEGIDKLNYIPTAGAVESFTGVLSGQVDATFSVMPVIKDYVETGEIKVLAVASEERSEDLPDVPTLTEAGLDVIFHRYTGIWTGGDVSDEAIQFWAEAIEKATQTEQWEKFLANRLLKPYYNASEDYVDIVKSDGEKFTEYVESIEK